MHDALLVVISAGVGGVVAYAGAFLQFSAERKAIKEDRKGEAFTNLLHACSEVLNSEDYAGKWQIYRAAEARFKLVGPGDATLKALHNWREDVDCYPDEHHTESPFDSIGHLEFAMKKEMGN